MLKKVMAMALAPLLLASLAWAETPPAYDADWEAVGKAIFFDTNLSTPRGQSCATCHDPAWGFTGPRSDVNAVEAIYPGAIKNRAGNRKPPTAAYGGPSPVLYEEEPAFYVGGMFWDGRATGWTLGDPLAEQGIGPFLNSVEMNNSSKERVIRNITAADYADAFAALYQAYWGEPLMSGRRVPRDKIDKAYIIVGYAIAAYERGAEVNPYSSRFDAFWDNVKAAGMEVAEINMSNWRDYKGFGLTRREVKGLALFNDESKGKCSLCHVLDEGPDGRPLFTDFTYDNLGVPKNPDNPFYNQAPWINPAGADWVDLGLGGFLAANGLPGPDENMGKVKVPTLRNVNKKPNVTDVKAYTHNGFFKTLKDVVHFYNTRDVAPWPAPEVAMNVNDAELGDLGLNDNQEDLIVEFMMTLSDQ